ncbi:MAG TPA: ABC transporter ATP-binding protein [Gammaproteobacteria bacterium]|nr:ABC transporter ATP-binding protein [Gammaproteobacteria bacterium]
MSTPLLEARALTVAIAGKCVCRNLDLRLAAGDCLALLGPNGVGKTTLLHTLAGLRAPVHGEILLAGRPIQSLSRRRIAQRLGLLMQQPEDSLPASVLEIALIGRHPHIDFWRWESHADVNLARRALKLAGLEGLEQRVQNQLSGGERRRLDIATILTQDSPTLLLDEPAHQLDLHYQLALLAHFQHLARDQGHGIIMSLHDVNLAARFCTQVLLLHGKGETMLAPVTSLNAEILSRLYHVTVTAVRTPGGNVFLPG